MIQTIRKLQKPMVWILWRVGMIDWFDFIEEDLPVTQSPIAQDKHQDRGVLQN